MQARRTVLHPEGGWSAVAVHLERANEGQEGFYLTLFPESRPPNVIFLRGSQLLELVELVGRPGATDQLIWDYVAKIPMEPLLPSRSLSARLRTLLVDCADSLREAARALAERPRPAPLDAPEDPLELAVEAQDPLGDSGGSSGIG